MFFFVHRRGFSKHVEALKPFNLTCSFWLRTIGPPMIKNGRAFTLIELLIVVAIIAILAVIAVPNFLEAQTRAKIARVKADMRTIATGIESYAVDYNKPPTRHSNWNIVSPPGAAPRFYPPLDNKIFDPALPFANVGMHMITTPIAYLSSLAIDVFNKPVQALIQPGNGISDALDYWDPVQTDVFVCFCRNPAGSQYRPGVGRGYMIVSVGPDQFIGLLALNGYPASPETSNQFRQIYDPSNGTVSVGNVIRSPGDLSQFDLQLDPTF
jgi:prepilin-type N-terminal cleavage/methylation domain-containing protein